MLFLRSQFFDFLREFLYKHALEHLEAAGPEHSKCLSIIDLFEGL